MLFIFAGQSGSETQGIGVAVGSAHVGSAALSYLGRTPHTLLLLQRGSPPTGDSSAQTSPARVLPHGLQFFMNYTSVGPFHGVPSPSGRLLQRWSPLGSQVLLANLLQHRLLSPRGRRSCQEPAPAQASHRVTASFGHVHLHWRGVLSGLQVGILLHHGPAWAAGGQPSSPWSSSWVAGESLLWHLEHLLPLLLH